MISRVAGVAMLVSAITSQVLAFDDDDLFSGWSEGDAFANTVAERLPQGVPVVAVHPPVEPVVAAIPSGIDAVVASQEVVNHAIVAPKKVVAVHNVGPVSVVSQHVVPQVVGIKPVLKTTIHSVHHNVGVHQLHHHVAVAQANFDHNLQAIKKVEAFQVANGTSSDLEKQLVGLRAESKNLAKILYDAQQDISKTNHAAEETARNELSTLAQETEKERTVRLQKRAANEAARLKRRAEAKRARITAYQQKVADINTKYANTKSAVVGKYTNTTSTAKQNLYSIRKNIRKLKMRIVQKKREELNAARSKINEQLKAAQDQVAKFNSELLKLGATEHTIMGHPAVIHHHPHHGVAAVIPVGRASTIVGHSGPVAVSTLPARLAALATATNPAAAKRIAKRSRAVTTVKANKLAKIAKKAKDATINARRNAVKAAKLQYRAQQAQREYVAASTTEATVHQAIRQTAANAAFQAAAEIGAPTVSSNFVPVRYIN